MNLGLCPRFHFLADTLDFLDARTKITTCGSYVSELCSGHMHGPPSTIGTFSRPNEEYLHNTLISASCARNNHFPMLTAPTPGLATHSATSRPAQPPGDPGYSSCDDTTPTFLQPTRTHHQSMQSSVQLAFPGLQI
jgi:hypothetical protein